MATITVELEPDKGRDELAAHLRSKGELPRSRLIEAGMFDLVKDWRNTEIKEHSTSSADLLEALAIQFCATYATMAIDFTGTDREAQQAAMFILEAQVHKHAAAIATVAEKHEKRSETNDAG